MIPNEFYELRLYNHTGTLIDILRSWSRFEFHQRINSSWNHQLTFEMSIENPLADQLRAIQPDYFLLAYRIDPLTLDRRLVYEGFNTTIVDQLRANGDVIINLYGVGYTQLLSRRIVIPPPLQEHNTKIGFAETVAKGYVYDCMIGSAIFAREMPGVTIEADGGRGNYMTQNIRYINLQSVVESVARDGGLDFGFVGSDPPGNFQFQARPRWGTDRRPTSGNPPTVFDIFMNNMEIPIYTRNYSEEKNYVYMGGAGEGVNRVIQEVSYPDAVAISPWGRKESFADARQEDTTSGLISDGYAYLEENKAKIDLTFNVRQTAGMRWLRNWELGDYIAARYFEAIFEKQVVEVSVIVSSASGGSQVEVINAELANIPDRKV